MKFIYVHVQIQINKRLSFFLSGDYEICLVRQDKTLHINTKKSNSNSRGSGSYHGFQVNVRFLYPKNLLHPLRFFYAFKVLEMQHSFEICSERF